MEYEEFSCWPVFVGYCCYVWPFSFNDISLQIAFDCRIAKERVHLAYKHPELLLDLMKKGIISTSLACNDLEVNIRACHDQQGDTCVVREKKEKNKTIRSVQEDEG